MKLKNKILAGMAGTTAMTFFSYAWSSLQQKQFREPVLLYSLLKNKNSKKPETNSEAKVATAWILHYMTGAIFSIAYTDRVMEGKKGAGLKKATLMGGLNGMAGVVIWQSVLKLHPNPPKNDRTSYYLHLFLAHLVFGWTTGLTLLYLEGEKRAEK